MFIKNVHALLYWLVGRLRNHILHHANNLQRRGRVFLIIILDKFTNGVLQSHVFYSGFVEQYGIGVRWKLPREIPALHNLQVQAFGVFG